MCAIHHRKWGKGVLPMDWLTVIFLVSERKTELIFVMANIYVYIKKFSYPDYKYVLTGKKRWEGMSFT